MLLTRSIYFTSIIVASVGTDYPSCAAHGGKGKQEFGRTEAEMKNAKKTMLNFQ
jgi:hypothetical protein